MKSALSLMKNIATSSATCRGLSTTAESAAASESDSGGGNTSLPMAWQLAMPGAAMKRGVVKVGGRERNWRVHLGNARTRSEKALHANAILSYKDKHENMKFNKKDLTNLTSSSRFNMQISYLS